MTLTFLFLILSGIVINVMSALFGIGGGVLLVPILRTLFPQMPIQMIAATSLTIVMSTSLINLILLRYQKIHIDLKSLLFWSIGMIFGVQLGFELSFLLAEQYIIAVFVFTLLILALRTFFSRHQEKINSDESAGKDRYQGMFFCSLGGFVAGITGIGGGSILAPLVNQLKSVKREQVAVYTNAMMFLGGIGNLFGYIIRPLPPEYQQIEMWHIGYINLTIVGIVVLASLLMSPISMQLRGKINAKWSNLLLGWILLAIGCYMVILQFMK
ncbi:hypothetical protein A4G19_07575 [Pasteurellaceae bacterium Macca]|nr:hypothetical protein [Pasteurellaceae bacterium Macca]